jgi:hypothetical protein
LANTDARLATFTVPIRLTLPVTAGVAGLEWVLPEVSAREALVVDSAWLVCPSIEGETVRHRTSKRKVWILVFIFFFLIRFGVFVSSRPSSALGDADISENYLGFFQRIMHNLPS